MPWLHDVSHVFCRVGDFDLRSTEDAVAVGLGPLLMGPALARAFGRCHTGNAPRRT